MSPTSIASIPETPPAMTPVRSRERIEVVDILRGFSILGILLVNMLAFAGYATSFPEAHYFHDLPSGFIHRCDITAVIHLDRLGSDTGNGLVVHQVSGHDNLFDLLVASAGRLDVAPGETTRHRYQQLFSGEKGTLVVTWGDPPPALASDTLDNVNAHHSSQAAQVVNLTLITAAHEPRY